MSMHSRKDACLHACVMLMSYHDSKLWSPLWLRCKPMHTRSSIGYMCNVNEVVVTIMVLNCSCRCHYAANLDIAAKLGQM